MHHRIHRTVAGALAAAAAMLSLTGCTPPWSISVAVPTIAPALLPAAPSSVSPPLVATGPAPALANTGTNWAPMVASLLTYGQWLLANPGSGTVAPAAAPGCPLAAQLESEVASLTTEGWRLAPARLTLSSLGAPSTLAPGETTVTLPVVASHAPEAVVDANGLLASQEAALPPATFDVSLLLGGDGRWRLCSAQPAEPVLTADGTPVVDPSLF